METRKLTAKEGKVFTNGEDFGRIIELGIYDSPDNWHEITVEEYEAIQEAERNRILNEVM